MKRATEDRWVRRVQSERRDRWAIQACQEVQGTSACKVHLVLRARLAVQVVLDRRAGGVLWVQTALWEKQALKAPRVKEVNLDKKESLDSLAKLEVQGTEAPRGSLGNQASLGAPGRGDLTASLDPEDLLEKLDQMESRALRVDPVLRGSQAPLENLG